MSLATLGIDAYQLTTLVAHHDLSREAQRVSMAFFFRKLPQARNYVVFCGLRQLLAHAAAMQLDERELTALMAHPILGPAFETRPALVDTLRNLRGFEGEIDALDEGTLVFSGPAVGGDGRPITVAEAPLHIYAPILQVRTDMVRAKLV